MSYERNENTLLVYKVKKAVSLLRKEIETISSVQKWAEEAGVSRRWLCKAMKKVYGHPPKVIIRKIRYEMILDCMDEDPEISGYCLAKEVGMSDEKALYKFLSVHFDSSLTQLRIKYVRKNLEE